MDMMPKTACCNSPVLDPRRHPVNHVHPVNILVRCSDLDRINKMDMMLREASANAARDTSPSNCLVSGHFIAIMAAGVALYGASNEDFHVSGLGACVRPFTQ